jgi:hypothetical protein
MDKVRPHKSSRTAAQIPHPGLTVLYHTSYISDMAPFPKLKECLREQRYRWIIELRQLLSWGFFLKMHICVGTDFSDCLNLSENM